MFLLHHTFLLVPTVGDPGKLLARGPGHFRPPMGWINDPGTTQWLSFGSRPDVDLDEGEETARKEGAATDGLGRTIDAAYQGGLLLLDKGEVVLPAYDLAWRALLVVTSCGPIETEDPTLRSALIVAQAMEDAGLCTLHAFDVQGMEIGR